MSYSTAREELSARIAEVRESMQSSHCSREDSDQRLQEAAATLDKIGLPELLRICADEIDSTFGHLDGGPETPLTLLSAMLAVRADDIVEVDGEKRFGISEDYADAFGELLSELRTISAMLFAICTRQLAYKLIDGEMNVVAAQEHFQE